jgi:PAS domain S-box-containing protein
MPSLLGIQPPALLQSVLDNVGVALAVIDHERKFVFTNKAALEMFGASEDLTLAEWRRQDFKLHDSYGRVIPLEQAPLLRVFAGEEVEPQEVRITFPDGRSKWLHVAARSFSVLGLTGVLVVVTDETEQVNLRKVVERCQRIEELALLAGGLAHDFNNVLSVVSANTELALTDEQLPEIHTRLRQMQSALAKGSALVARLIQYSRKNQPQIGPVQINEVVNDALELVRPLITSRVRVKTALFPDLPPVAADASRLEQVLVNLILNALDAMPHGGELTLRTKLSASDEIVIGENAGNEQFVTVAVTDTGAGIPENLRPMIFDVFFTTKAEGEREGAGIGLATAQAIVRQHNGHIKMESEIGAGTTFTIYLPRVPTARSQDEMEVT